MEQQTLSVAKVGFYSYLQITKSVQAGLICKLHTRTTILAATNAKGKYDPEKSITPST
jgi:DNA helicase MCM9